MRNRLREGSSPWLTVVWIVLGLLIAITVVSVLVMQTLAPGTLLVAA